MAAVETILFFLAVLTGALLAGSETGLYCLNRIRLRCRIERGNHAALRLQYLLKDTGKTIVAILVGTNVSYFAATVIFTRFLAKSDVGRPQLAAALILAPILFIFTESLPKNVFQQKADVLVYRVHSVLVALRCVFYPVILVLTGITRFIALFFGKHALPTDTLFTRQSLRYFFRESYVALTPYLGQITENIMSLHRITASDAMIPLAKVASVEINIPNEVLGQVMLDARFSRLPVYEGSPDHIVGILNCFDYLYEAEHREGIRHLVKPAVSFERATPIHMTLHRMQSQRQPMVIVTDAQGRAVGIVTLKDLVEEIVGELAEAV